MVLEQKAVILMGSKSDHEFARQIASVFDKFEISYDLRVASAHRTPSHLEELIQTYAKSSKESGQQIVLISVAGLSDALSGVLAAKGLFPVIACPPDLEKYTWAKAFSTAFTPQDVPVALVTHPEKAALFAIEIFALSNQDLSRKLAAEADERRKKVISDDKEVMSTTAPGPR
jgi:phosphoribosylaminoimidazole carboxylase PurE protein